jgi:hypothetical protein
MADIEISRKPPLAPGSVPAAALACLSFAGQPAPSGFIFYISLTHTPCTQQRGARCRRPFAPSKYPCAARPTRRSAPVRRPARISRTLPLFPSFLSSDGQQTET